MHTGHFFFPYLSVERIHARAGTTETGKYSFIIEHEKIIIINAEAEQLAHLRAMKTIERHELNIPHKTNAAADGGEPIIPHAIAQHAGSGKSFQYGLRRFRSRCKA